MTASEYLDLSGIQEELLLSKQGLLKILEQTLEIQDSLRTKTGSTRKKPLQLDYEYLEAFRKDVEEWQARALLLVHRIGEAKGEPGIASRVPELETPRK